jgi:hypothetical protein
MGEKIQVIIEKEMPYMYVTGGYGSSNDPISTYYYKCKYGHVLKVDMSWKDNNYLNRIRCPECYRELNERVDYNLPYNGTPLNIPVEAEIMPKDF